MGAWIETKVLLGNDFITDVASYMGAWIETIYRSRNTVISRSHPTWVRGLKLMMKVCLVMDLRRILHGCVDWNIRINALLVNPYRSHPTWVRGLKLLQADVESGDWMSHPTWVRGLKLCECTEYNTDSSVASYMGAWIETGVMSKTQHSAKSHPTWVRGLKHIWWTRVLGWWYCRILHGCVDWNYSKNKTTMNEVGRILHGCVDWNFSVVSLPRLNIVASYMGAWIETIKPLSYDLYFESHPTWVRGLKRGWFSSCSRWI